MKSKAFSYYLFLWLSFFFIFQVQAQGEDQKQTLKEISSLFNGKSILTLELTYAKKELLELTNDSTYIKSKIAYLENNDDKKYMDVELRARGHYRRSHCYYVPLWLKISEDVSKGSIFEADKKLKIVLPCLKSKKANDHIIKEYLAYKIYEILSPYYFETKLVPIDLQEAVNNKKIDHELVGILIQDDDQLAAAYHGEVIKRNIHPKAQDPVCSVRNALFQFMIGNTDYSITYQHNEKIFYIDKKIVPVPYDFDMSGLVNPSYAVVSVVNNNELPITEVTDRLYRGFDRDEKILEQVRQEFLMHEPDVFKAMDQYQTSFKDPKEFVEARKFISEFYTIIKDDRKFENKILKRVRTQLR